MLEILIKYREVEITIKSQGSELPEPIVHWLNSLSIAMVESELRITREEKDAAKHS